MKTIYELLIQCQRRMTLKCFKSNVNKPLILLLKKISHIDLSNEPYPFVADGGSLTINVTVNYRFKYGRVAISANEHDIEVDFFFDPSYLALLNITLHSNRCTVNVDHNLNFIKATFNQPFSFYKKDLKTEYNEHNYFNIMLSHTIELEKTYNSLSYNFNHLDKYLKINGFDKRFYMHNFDLELLLIKFINFVAYNPDVFYLGFSKYPSYHEIIMDLNAIVNFINMFIDQYFNDHDNLIYTINQHLLLIDMDDI